MSNISIILFDENSIARYFQLVALSVIYDSADLSLRAKLEKGYVYGEIELPPNEFDETMNLLVTFMKDRVCKVKESLYGPKLYGAGTNDRKILGGIGINVEKGLTCDSLIEYYDKNLLHKKANERVKVPMYLRAYVFSSYRDARKAEDTNVASLYLATAGAIISIIGRVFKADSSFELYVNPDLSLETLRIASRLYNLLNEPRYEYRLHRMIQDIVNLEGISLELATHISIALYVYLIAEKVLKLQSLRDYSYIFEKFKLVCIKPEDRPLVLWERPLTLTNIFERLESSNALKLLEALDQSVRHALRLGKEINDFPSVISSCINDLNEYMETGIPDAITHCSGGMIRLYDKLDEECSKGNTQACISGKTLADILQYLNKLL